MKAAVSPFPILELTNVMPVARTLPEALRASAVTQMSIASRPDSLTTRPSSRKAGGVRDLTVDEMRNGACAEAGAPVSAIATIKHALSAIVKERVHGLGISVVSGVMRTSARGRRAAADGARRNTRTGPEGSQACERRDGEQTARYGVEMAAAASACACAALAFHMALAWSILAFASM